MEMINRAGYVIVQNELAGVLEDTSEGYMFCYDEEYLRHEDAAAVSLTLPLRSEPYRSNVFFPFFDGLIPEGWLLDVVVDNWKINPRDRFGLLLATAKDCIGDVRIEEKII
ncbi:MAG: HipA N-terminal domain-containing protein [Blautia sp.]|nr:HipA N-terminal domain-containing protein [Blautia sp.]